MSRGTVSGWAMGAGGETERRGSRWPRVAWLIALCACGSSATSGPEPGDITVTVTSPSPGAELSGSDAARIVVSGTVATTSPDYGPLEAWVNGVEVPVQADGSFTTELVPSVGINHLKIEGGDGGPLVESGRVGGREEFDVLWAPDYLPAIPDQVGFDLPGALQLRLGQRFFDARLFGTALDLTTDPVIAHDLASALELILWHIDLASLLDGNLQVGGNGAALDVAIPSATPGDILVDVRAVDAPVPAVELSIDLDGVFLEMDGTFTFGNRTLVVAGGISADMHASATLALAIAEDGTVDVTATDITATVGPLVPSFTGPDGDELDAFITIGNSDFRTVIEDLVSQQLIPTFTDNIPPLLEQLLGAADSLLDNVEFTLDPGLGSPVTIRLDGQIGALDVTSGGVSGGVSVREDLAIRSTNSPLHPESRGAARLDADPAPPVTATAGVHLTLRQELLNSLLHTLWNAGLLEGSAEFGGLSATVSAKLPPVVRPTPPEIACSIDGQRCDFVLELGQLEVQLADFEQSFAINAIAGARVIVDGNTVSIQIQDTPTLKVWETSAVDGVLSTDAVRDVISNVVWPDLVDSIGSSLQITLPIPDLATLGLDQLAPGLDGAQLELLMRQRPDVTDGFLTLGADLELSAPPP